jgi:hypothetical protein
MQPWEIAMKASWLALPLAGALLAAGTMAAAAGPVAVVEQVTGSPAGVEFMDYLEAGKIIRLHAQETMVLSYLSSCVRERITGGTVVVGGEYSEVVGGSIERTRVDCDGGRMELTSEQANAFSGMVFRGGSQVRGASATR